MDSLYLSFAGVLNPATGQALETLKQAAQATDERTQSKAVLGIMGEEFEVSPKGRGRFPYVLRNNWFDLQLHCPPSRLPLCYAQIRNEVLARAGVSPVVGALEYLVGQLGDITEPATVSRIDLCADFVTDADLGALSERFWVKRAHGFVQRYERQQFTGCSIGEGGALMARLYDKTLEIQKSGKEYLYPMWREAGWDGVSRVWRLEFQIRRSVLGECGLRTVPEVQARLPGLWAYACTDWLRLVIPSETDATQTRWPEHPLWGVLRASPWLGQSAEPLRRVSTTRDPSDHRLFVHGLGAITSFMARHGITRIEEALDAYAKAAQHYHRARGEPLGNYAYKKARSKARRFNRSGRFGRPEGEA